MVVGEEPKRELKNTIVKIQIFSIVNITEQFFFISVLKGCLSVFLYML
jgi:hypothetical protein